MRSVSFDGIDPKQVRAILESVEKAVIISLKGYGLRKDGEARVKPPTAFERYYDTVKNQQSRKEALESFRLMNEAKEAQQADQRRQLQSKRLNLNKVTLEQLETALPNFPKGTLAQIIQARTIKPFDSWKAVAQVHGVGEKVLQNLKVYFDTPGIAYPVQSTEDELVG